MATQITEIQEAMNAISRGEPERRAALTFQQQVTVRIFDQGKDKNNQSIGKYSEGYVKQRRKKGLGSNPKVVLQFTGQMRNGFTIVEHQGKIGLGFLNNTNLEKSYWVEDTYKKEVFSATTQEKNLYSGLLEKEINRLIN